MTQSRLRFSHLQPLVACGVACLRVVHHRFLVGQFGWRINLDVFPNPIRHLTIADRLSHHFDELLVVQPGSFKPQLIETPPEIRLIVFMEPAGQMQANLIDIPGQMHPSTHGFARAAGINDVVHRMK